MLANLGGEPLINWVIKRVQSASLVSEIVVATSDQAIDDMLADHCADLGVRVFRGDEQDVLGRVCGAASAYHTEGIVRICADNPFIDGAEIDRLITFFESKTYDYVCNHLDRWGSGYADGFGAEIISAELLHSINASEIAEGDREHVTKFVVDRPDIYNLGAVSAPPSLAYPELRFDVDRIDDLEYLRRLVALGVSQTSSAAQIVRLALAFGKDQPHDISGPMPSENKWWWEHQKFLHDTNQFGLKFTSAMTEYADAQPSWTSAANVFLPTIIHICTGAYMSNWQLRHAQPLQERDVGQTGYVTYQDLRTNQSQSMPRNRGIWGFVSMFASLPRTIAVGPTAMGWGSIIKIILRQGRLPVPLRRLRYDLNQFEKEWPEIAERLAAQIDDKELGQFIVARAYTYCRSLCSKRPFRWRFFGGKLIAGSPQNFDVRFAALAARDAGAVVILLEHGNVSDVFDEPLRKYSELSAANICIRFGARNSATIDKMLFEPSFPRGDVPHCIEVDGRLKTVALPERLTPQGCADLRDARILYIPTSTSGHEQYGPFRNASDHSYIEWWQHLLKLFPHMVFKFYPNEKASFVDTVPSHNKAEGRPEELAQDYDVIFVDHISTVVANLASLDVPIVLLDIGLRNLSVGAQRLLNKRVTHVPVSITNLNSLAESIQELWVSAPTDEFNKAHTAGAMFGSVEDAVTVVIRNHKGYDA